ncbi:ATP-binding protein [Pollutibacter soli]|uniref:sensor histidine kinase n=1 Tax=Pollutibacter soli TaxID=3034157 RepID=UPI0030134B50
MKSQAKIALLFFGFSISIILLISAFVYYFSARHFYTEFNVRLKIRAVVAAKAVLDVEDERTPAYREIREQHLERLPDEKEFFFPIASPAGLKEKAKALKLPEVFFDDLIQKGNSTYRDNNTLFTGLKYQSDKGTYAVIVSASNKFYREHQSYLQKVLIGAVVLATLLTFMIAVIFSRKVFDPVRQITQKVKEISSENMHLRVEKKNYSDEISDLVVTFNHMLDRLETAFATQNNFISNASHELSTPLTAIIGEAEVTLSKERAAADYKDSLQVILNEAERLEKVTRSLLFLAQTGFDGKKQSMDRIRADQIIWDVKETMDRLVPGNKIIIDLALIPDSPEKLKVRGNMQLLHLAISNIVSNAIKYSGNKPVKISIGTGNQHVIIVVKDEGIGIPSSELKYIYDPFFRASNTKQYEGFGIGLPLSRNIIRLHGGVLQVDAEINKGTTVQISLPLFKPETSTVVI